MADPTPEWAVRVRALRTRNLLSQEAMAERLEVDRTTIARWEAGQHHPQPQQVRRICHSFAVSPGDLALLPSGDMDLTTPVSRRRFLADVAAGGAAAVALPIGAHRIAPADDVHPVEHLRQLRAVLVESDNMLGPATVIPTVEQYIQVIQHLREARNGQDAIELLRMRAQFAEFAGWLHQDIGDWQAAQRWLDRAMEWSHAGGDRELVAYILARKSQLAGDMGDPTSAIDLASAAGAMTLDRNRLAATAPTYAAYGHALAGDGDPALRALEKARTIVSKLDAPGRWASWLDLAYIDIQTARCLSVLGRHQEAAAIFQQAIRDLPQTYRRDRGVYLGREAIAHAGARDPEQAAAAGMRAIAIANETRSGRILNELSELARRLATWSTLPPVSEFRDALRSVTAGGL